MSTSTSTSLVPFRTSSPSFLLYAAVSAILGVASACNPKEDPRVVFAICANATIVSTLFLTRILQLILVGPLRNDERSRIISESYLTLAESLLLLTIFRSQLSPAFLALYIPTMVLKPFHTIVNDRSDRLEANLHKPAPRARFLFALFVLGAADAFIAIYAYTRGISPVLFLMESSIALLSTLNALSLFTLSRTSYSQSVTPQLILQLTFDTLRFAVHLPFLIFTVQSYALPIHTLKDVYLETKSMSVALSGLRKAREANRWLEDSLGSVPVLSSSESEDCILGDGTCLVCRDDLDLASCQGDEQARVLPCRHAFHLGCLRVWVERQRSCPTCRAKLTPTHHSHDEREQFQRAQKQCRSRSSSPITRRTPSFAL